MEILGFIQVFLKDVGINEKYNLKLGLPSIYLKAKCILLNLRIPYYFLSQIDTINYLSY